MAREKPRSPLNREIKLIRGLTPRVCVFLLCRITPDLTDRFNAGEIIKGLSVFVDGKGGGRKDMAEGGGTKVSELKNALSKTFDMISEHSAR